MNIIDLLVIFPCNQKVLDDIKLVNDYNSMQAFFINQAIKKLSNKNIVCVGLDNLWKPKQKGVKNKITLNMLQSSLQEYQINFGDCNHVLFTHLGAHKQFHKTVIDEILQQIYGAIFKFEDFNHRLFTDQPVYTIGHYTKGDNIFQYFDAEISIASDIFLPNQSYDDRIFKVHVDHNFHGRNECFDEIKNFLYDLENRLKKSNYWKTLEVYYHDRLCKIDEIGHFNYNHLDIVSLAEIYGQCHLSFVSHRETLGQYPFEMLSAGVGVVLLQNSFLNGPVRQKIDSILIKSIDELSLDPSDLKRSGENYRSISLNYSYDLFVDKMLGFIFSYPSNLY